MKNSSTSGQTTSDDFQRDMEVSHNYTIEVLGTGSKPRQVLHDCMSCFGTIGTETALEGFAAFVRQP